MAVILEEGPWEFEPDLPPQRTYEHDPGLTTLDVPEYRIPATTITLEEYLGGQTMINDVVAKPPRRYTV